MGAVCDVFRDAEPRCHRRVSYGYAMSNRVHPAFGSEPYDAASARSLGGFSMFWGVSSWLYFGRVYGVRRR